ncbi:MAG: M3 family metallopeptidase, partial [Alphaproteobacteria bacterium]
MTVELLKWTGPEGLPDFSKISVDDFIPAIKQHLAWLKETQQKFSDLEDEPTFKNTFYDLDLAMLAFDDPAAVFYQLAGNHTNPDLQAIEAEIGGLYQDYFSWLLSNRKWFKRIDTLYQKRDSLGLKPDELRLLEKGWNNLQRNGANLNDNDQTKLATINKRLNELFTQFGQNVLASEQDYALFLGKDDLDGLPNGLVNAMKAAAEERSTEGYAVTLSRSIVDPFLTFSTRRDLRETAFKAWAARGEGTADGEKDNRPLIKEIVQLRAQKATLLGYKTFADFKLDKVTMAKTPQAVSDLLSPVWEKAKARAKTEKQEIEEFV